MNTVYGRPSRVRIAAGISDAEAAEHARSENIPLALVGWLSGSVMIWSALFTIGNFLYGRLNYAGALLIVFLTSLGVLIRIVHRLWR